MQVSVRVQAKVGWHPTSERIPERGNRPNGTVNDGRGEHATESHHNARQLTDGRQRTRSKLRNFVDDQIRTNLVEHGHQIGSHHGSCKLGKETREEDCPSLARCNGEHLGMPLEKLSLALVTVHARGANREAKALNDGAGPRRRRPNDLVSGIT